MSQEYTLDFYQALKILENNEGWIQGEQFADGIIMLMDPFLITKNFKVGCDKHNVVLTRGVLKQKYRIVTTQPDAERK